MMLDRQAIPAGSRATSSWTQALKFVLLALGLLTLSACAGRQVMVPPLTEQPTGVQYAGKVVWVDLFTDDLEQARGFYQDVFGWEFVQTEPDSVSVNTVLLNGVPIGNAIQLTKDQAEFRRAQWLSYFSTADVDQTVARATARDATVDVAAKPMPNRGRVSALRDPQGAGFAIVASDRGDPVDQGPSSGDWLGSELWTWERDAAVAFYQDLFDYGLDTVSMPQGEPYYLLVSDDVPRAGVVTLPKIGVNPAWVPYVLVDDATASVGRAEAAGGRILRPLGEPGGAGQGAIIADPTGAVFGIQQP
jgi:predicted enzyme related to lactoylglutathione lyase